MNGSNKRGEKAFLYLVSAAITDLGMRNPVELDKMLSDLKFHAQHIIGLIPESDEGAISETERLYTALMESRESMQAEYGKMTAEEWSDGVRRRQVLKDIYDALN